MISFIQEKRESAADLWMTYLSKGKYFSDKTATIAFAFGIELLWSEEDLKKISKGSNDL